MPALKNERIIRLNTIKLPEKNRKKRNQLYSVRKLPHYDLLGVWWYLCLWDLHARKIKWKLLVIDYWKRIPKNLSSWYKKPVPRVEQRKTEKRRSSGKMQQLRCLRWHKLLGTTRSAVYTQFLISKYSHFWIHCDCRKERITKESFRKFLERSGSL